MREDIEAEARLVVLEAAAKFVVTRSWVAFVAGVTRNLSYRAVRRSLSLADVEPTAPEPQPFEFRIPSENWAGAARGCLEKALVEFVIGGGSCAAFAEIKDMPLKEVNRVARRIAARINAARQKEGRQDPPTDTP